MRVVCVFFLGFLDSIGDYIQEDALYFLDSTVASALCVRDS
ncbi:unnamed protein product, partial [marine sediment metagenome]